MRAVSHLTMPTLGAIALAVMTSLVLAQSYPSRPITIVVPLAAGSGVDLVARVYGDRLAKSLGKAVVVDDSPRGADRLDRRIGRI